jgi:hypothetical protein
MQRAEAPYEIDGMNANDRPIRKQLGEGTQGDAIFGIVECWDEHRSIRDIEVGVTGG